MSQPLDQQRHRLENSITCLGEEKNFRITEPELMDYCKISVAINVLLKAFVAEKKLKVSCGCFLLVFN